MNKFLIYLFIFLACGLLTNCRFFKGQLRQQALKDNNIECDSSKANLIVESYRTSLIHGDFERYDSLGCLIEKGEYRKGQKLGLWEYYFRGQLNYLIYYTKKDTVVWETRNVAW